MSSLRSAEIWENPTVRRILQPKRIPLLFSVTIIAGIFYHYSPELTWLWILLSVLLQWALFKLFDFVNEHHILGGIAYLGTGFCLLVAALWFMQAGGEGGVFAPKDQAMQIDFFVWFMTPQSVLPTKYISYTIALFILFSFFIASITYYFTIVRYRVLMSFMVMIFPFAIYAKEAEDMPVPSIILLLLCYFAVMIYCRQAHSEHPELVQVYEPNCQSRLKMPPHKSENAEKTPELLDRRFMLSGGIFLSAASIAVLIIPKPTVTADRSLLETMLNLSALTNYLENAISGFSESSDGGSTFLPTGYSRTLFYADAEETPLNVKVQTFSDYDYESNKWFASDYDSEPDENDPRWNVDAREYAGVGYLDPEDNSLKTVSSDQHPFRLLDTVIKAAKLDSAFAERWNITALADETLQREAYLHRFEMIPTSYNSGMYPAPNHTAWVFSRAFGASQLYQNESGVIYRYNKGRSFYEVHTVSYYSDDLADSSAAQTLMRQIPSQQWAAFLSDLKQTAEASGDEELLSDAQAAVTCFLSAKLYAQHINSKTPERVQALALQLTDGLGTDYEKAAAIYDYLKYGAYTYSLSYSAPEPNNVEYFLFESKTGVCYQFASAMAELCRAAGLPVRYVEGYMVNEENKSLTNENQWPYVITTEHTHAFTEVYLSGYGWLMMDATAPSTEPVDTKKGNVLSVLQIAGLILFGTALLLIFVFVWLLPRLRELLFRMKFRRRRDAAVVQEAFARLRKQWKAEPAKTARDLCDEQSAFLGVDLSTLCTVFEETLYANRCTPEQADRFYAVYCAAYDAFKPACKRAARAEKAAAKAARAARAAAHA